MSTLSDNLSTYDDLHEHLDLEAFRGWLEAHKPGTVGLAHNAYHCPLAMYLKDAGFRVIAVDTDEVFVKPKKWHASEGNVCSHGLYRALNAFVYAVDQAHSGAAPRQVDRDEALAILNRVEGRG